MSAEHSHLLLLNSPAIKHPGSDDEDSGQQIHDSYSMSPGNGSPPIVSGVHSQAPPSISPYKGINIPELEVITVSTITAGPGTSEHCAGIS